MPPANLLLQYITNQPLCPFALLLDIGREQENEVYPSMSISEYLLHKSHLQTKCHSKAFNYRDTIWVAQFLHKSLNIPKGEWNLLLTSLIDSTRAGRTRWCRRRSWFPIRLPGCWLDYISRCHRRIRRTLRWWREGRFRPCRGKTSTLLNFLRELISDRKLWILQFFRGSTFY